jgi:hypothetical protein
MSTHSRPFPVQKKLAKAKMYRVCTVCLQYRKNTVVVTETLYSPAICFDCIKELRKMNR